MPGSIVAFQPLWGGSKLGSVTTDQHDQTGVYLVRNKWLLSVSGLAHANKKWRISPLTFSPRLLKSTGARGN